MGRKRGDWMAVFVVLEAVAVLLAMILGGPGVAHSYDARVRHSQVAGATRYQVAAAPLPSGTARTWTIPSPTPPDPTRDLTSTVSGIDGARRYSFTVVAQNDVAVSPRSNSIIIEPSSVQTTTASAGVTLAGAGRVESRTDALSRRAIYFATTTADLAGTATADTATWAINVAAAGDLYVWARCYAVHGPTPASGDANSFWLQLDGGTPRPLCNSRLATSWGVWHWAGDGVRETVPVGPLKLTAVTAGTHQLRVKKREVTPTPPRLDVILITADKDLVPTDALVAARLATCASNADCNDGNACTTDACSGTPAACAYAPKAAGAACSLDTNPCTTEACDAGGVCRALANVAPCNDGLFCNGFDTCAAATCSNHLGDPCTAPQLCDEANNACVAPLTCATRWDFNGDGAITVEDAQGLAAYVAGTASLPACVE